MTGTQVEIFTDFGKAGLQRLEQEVNEWLLDNDEIDVISLTPAMCTVGESGGELYQCFAITVWYREAT
jgi:hypothetical protein